MTSSAAQDSTKNHRKTLPYGAIGIGASVFWLAAVGFLVWWSGTALSKLSLNQWGDSLSGFLAGLAILWLVLSFFQQAEELRQNTEALRAQREELKLQRRETQALVEQATRQAQAAEAQAKYAELQADQIRKRAWPLFSPVGGQSQGENRFEGKFKNTGGSIRNATVVHQDGCSAAIQHPDVEAGANLVVKMERGAGVDANYPSRFDIQCRTSLGELVRTTFYYEGGTNVRCDETVEVDTED